MVKISLDWEEQVFRGLRHLWRRAAGSRSVAPPDDAVVLDDRLAAHLSTLASLFGGRPILVRAARGAGGVHGKAILVPGIMAAFACAQDNRRALITRVTLAAIIKPSLHEELAMHGPTVSYLLAVGRALVHLEQRVAFDSGWWTQWRELAEVHAVQLRQRLSDVAPAVRRRLALELALLVGGLDGLRNELVAITGEIASEPAWACVLWGTPIEGEDLALAQTLTEASDDDAKAAQGEEISGGHADAVRRLLLADKGP